MYGVSRTLPFVMSLDLCFRNLESSNRMGKVKRNGNMNFCIWGEEEELVGGGRKGKRRKPNNNNNNNKKLRCALHMYKLSMVNGIIMYRKKIAKKSTLRRQKKGKMIHL